MDERTLQFRVGLLVAATVVIAVGLILLFEEFPGGLGGRKTVFIHFESAPGVTVNTPVRKSGILIGRVTSVELEEQGGVLITAMIDGHRKIRKNETARIASGNFLGDAMLEFVPSGVPGESNEPLEDGAYLVGIVSKDALALMGDAMEVVSHMSEDLSVALASVKHAGEEIGHVAQNLNVLVVDNQGQINRIMGKTENALGRFDTAMTAVQEVVTDEELRLQLKIVLEQVPQVLQDTSTLIAELNNVADEAEQNLIYLRGFTEPLGNRGESIVASFEDNLNQLDTLLLHLNQSIEGGEGSLAQFLNNPELYQRLNTAAGNIEDITYRLRPIVDDARVFTDKVARNPGRLLRGAIGKPQSGLK